MTCQDYGKNSDTCLLISAPETKVKNWVSGHVIALLPGFV